ncbi:MAG: 30S ribosomal protein S13 [DPANN group archaeon]|nr:30S ribosomal protein S13 [DPANN group archaeon]
MAEQKPQAKPAPAASREDKDFKYILRIANTDLDGKKQIMIAMKKIKGVGYMFANTVLNVAKIDHTKKTGTLDNDEIARLNDVLDNPAKFNIPSWLYNRRKDYESGGDYHLLTAELRFVNDNDIKRLKMIKTNRGVRHILHLPLRGQRTKSNFRRNKGKGSLGVKKKTNKK